MWATRYLNLYKASLPPAVAQQSSKMPAGPASAVGPRGGPGCRYLRLAWATRNDEQGLAVLQYRANAARLCLEPGGCRTADLGADRVEVF